MAVSPRVDPACREARALKGFHDREGLVVKDLPATRLAQLVGERRLKAFAEHDASCLRCWSYARSCAACRADLTVSPHAFSCRHNKDRWSALVRKAVAPLASEALRRPGLAKGAPEPAPAKAARPAAAAPPRPAAPAARAPRRTAWEVLGVRATASPDEVRAAYRAKAKDFHPDRVATLGPEFRKLAEQRMREVNAAYEEILRLAAPSRR